MRVTQADRDYMRRLGALESAAHVERQDAHRTLTIGERLRRSLVLSQQFRATANLERRSDDPTTFYDRARQLGLYRP